MADGKIFNQLLQLLPTIVAALHDFVQYESDMYDACNTLVELGKLKPGSRIIEDQKKNFTD